MICAATQIGEITLNTIQSYRSGRQFMISDILLS